MAALGIVLLTGCAAGPSPAEQSASASASAQASASASARADLIKSVCDDMRQGDSTASLAKFWVGRGIYPDVDTALYVMRPLIAEGCPQYAGR